MSENLLRQRQIKRHKENRPVDRMEPYNILSDKVQVGWPVFLIKIAVVAVGVISKPRYIICQRVKPHIDHMPVVKINRYSPFERGS